MTPGERERVEAAIRVWLGDEDGTATEELLHRVEQALAPVCICEWRDSIKACGGTFYCPVHDDKIVSKRTA